MYVQYTDYAAQWDDLAGVLSRDAVLKGSFDKYADSKRAKRGTAEVDAEFLKEIEAWRDALARNIAIRNSQLDQRGAIRRQRRQLDGNGVHRAAAVAPDGLPPRHPAGAPDDDRRSHDAPRCGGNKRSPGTTRDRGSDAFMFRGNRLIRLILNTVFSSIMSFVEEVEILVVLRPRMFEVSPCGVAIAWRVAGRSMKTWQGKSVSSRCMITS